MPANQVHALGVETLNPADLTPHPENPNHGDVDAIAESLTTTGQYRPVVINQDGVILAGHHVVQAAIKLGWTELRAERIHATEQQARRILLADNRLAELGPGLDPEALADALAQLDDLTGTGYDDQFLTDLAASLNTPEVHGDPDDVPNVRSSGRAKRGQAWQLGPHRLYIGDSTNTTAVLAWLGDDRADCVWTDPPYGVDYVGKTKDALTIDNDGAADLPQLLTGAFTTAIAAARPGAPAYIACPPGPEFAHFIHAMQQTGIAWRQTLTWVKNTMVLGRSDYHYKHEPILYGFTPTAPGIGRLGRGGQHWFGDNAQTSVLEYDKPAANPDHPTMKPVDLVAHMLRNSCRTDGLVLDLFGGSGTTMAAAHITGRRAALVEYDPKYGNVILARYEKLTGNKAELLGTVTTEDTQP